MDNKEVFEVARRKIEELINEFPRPVDTLSVILAMRFLFEQYMACIEAKKVIKREYDKTRVQDHKRF